MNTQNTIKNRELLPIGTRVRFAHDKLSTREGTVMEVNKDRIYGENFTRVLWDGDEFPKQYLYFEIRPV